MDQVLTLVAHVPGSLTLAIVAEAAAILNALGAETREADWLADGEACDLPFTGVASSQAEAEARKQLSAEALDMVALPIKNRRKRLLLADMDSTIVTSETLDDLAAFAGLKETIAAITARAMNGELNFEAAIGERVGMLAGLSEDTLAAAYEDIELTPGADVLVRTMRAHGAHAVLVSGGFKYFTSRVAARCGFDEDHANDFIIENGKLTGDVVHPIQNKDSKLAMLRHQIKTFGLDPAETLAVGDGANDLPMIEAAGLGVAFHGKPVVAAAAPARIDHGDLSALLFFQGYRRTEFSI